MYILIDNGHGSDTPGKRSPDGKFLEYQHNRIIATRVVSDLVDCGYDAELLVPEDIDIPLRELSVDSMINATLMAQQMSLLYQLTSTQPILTANGIKPPVGVPTPLQASPNQICWQWTYMKPHARISPVRSFASSTDHRNMRYLQSSAGMKAITMLHADGIPD